MNPVHERDTILGLVIGLAVMAGVALGTGSAESLTGLLRFAVAILVFVGLCRGIARFLTGSGATAPR